MKRTKTPLVTWITTAALLISMCASLTFSQRTRAHANNRVTRTQSGTGSTTNSSYPMLAKYATDLTLLALNGKLEPALGYEANVARVIASLATTTKAPLVLGESDLDRDAIARGVATQIAFGNVPDTLRNKRVFRLSIDALAKDAHTSEEFEQRVQSVFAEAEQAQGRVILFVDQMHQYAGARATKLDSATVTAAIEGNHFKVIGGVSPEAYANYIATDESIAKLFDSISIDGASAVSSAATVTRDKRKSPINEEFEGEKISSDMRELMQSAGPNGRVTAILQVDDVRNPQIASLLKQQGVVITDAMAQLGTLKVQLSPKAIEALAKSGSTNYISPDVKMESFGHVTSTTGADQVRNAPGLIGSLLGGNAIDGTGIGIAILDSGLDNSHAAFAKDLLGAARIKLNKDFTGENNPANDPYGHGTHVIGALAGVSSNGGNTYQGIAPNANIINLRVLNAQGVGSVSALLAALNWILAPADPTMPVSSGNPRNKDKYNIRIVNMSLGAPAVSSYMNDPVCRAARALVDAGIVVVAAAGNNGKDAMGNKIYGQIHSPGAEPSVITVGAANTFGTDSHADDGVATYSSRGPTRGSYTDANNVRHYDNLLKPDLIAPGNKAHFSRI